jgi:hypothetical protein
MQLTKPEHIGASQLIRSVRRTCGKCGTLQRAGLGANEPCDESRSAKFVLADLCGKPLEWTGTVVNAKQQARPTNPKFTPLQGQYLAFIRTYTLLHREPPAEMDMQHFFRVTTWFSRSRREV